MPPKKKGKGKKKKKAADDGADGGRMSPTFVALHFQRANEALQRNFALRREEARSAQIAKRELQQQVVDLKGDFEAEQKATFEITADMTRQYKGMQEELLSKVNLLEGTIAELKDQLELSRIALDDLKQEKERAIAQKDAENAEMKQKMDEMANEFAEMLKETLEKMSERIEITNNNWENETGVPIIQRLEEFNLAGAYSQDK